MLVATQNKNTEVTMKSYKHFTLLERESLAEKLKEGKSFRQIAKEMGRSPSTISREVKRNYSKTSNRYHPWRATTLYIVRRKKSRRKCIVDINPELKKYVIEKLKAYWSPEEIADRGKSEGYNISTSTIYRAVYGKKLDGVTAKSNLRRRGYYKYKKNSKKGAFEPEHTIHERPEVCERKERIGDFEGDTVCGAVGSGCLVTLVDRKSKLLLAYKSDNKIPLNVRQAVKNAVKLSGIDISVESITFDRGTEFMDFKGIEQDLDTTVYFADPHSPWQRGLNENTNGIIRFFFPKGCNFHQISDEEIKNVVDLFNNRPRKCLGYLSPLEFLSKKCCT